MTPDQGEQLVRILIALAITLVASGGIIALYTLGAC